MSSAASDAEMEHNNAPLRSPFDDDDAFSEGDDSDKISFARDFSASAIRAELAKNMAKEVDESVTDASVSTLDIDGVESPHEMSTRTTSYQSYRSFGTVDSSSQFSQVSLSDGEIHGSPEPEEVDPYPTVHIDVSQDGVKEIQVALDEAESPSLSPDGSQPSSLHGKYPPNSAPTSRADFPTTPTVSAITPSLSVPSQYKPDPTKGGHRPTRSAGPSTLDKVISKTRPTFLPPKARDEDRKHLADWEHMMKHSRAVESKKKKLDEERRLMRERRIDQSIHFWEKAILPDWKVVNKNPAMRKLWWQGIPTKLRAVMWERAVGNALALSKDSYRTCLARAKRSILAGTFPTTTLALMDQDIRETLPNLHLFHPDSGAMYGELKDMLCAWVVSRGDEALGYVMGISKVAAMFVLNMPPPEGFVAMRNLLDRHCMRSFYGGASAKDDVEAYYRIFDTMLADAMPKIYFNFKQHQISPAAYLPDWLIPLFLNHLDLSTCAHLWDVLLLEGDSFLYRAALAVLAVLEPRLFFPDRTELLELLKGENKAALEIAKREHVPIDGPKYDIYGVSEEAIWEKIDSMEEWWKDSTWTRLILRELPDL